MKTYEVYVNGVWVGDVCCGYIENAVTYGEEYYGKDGDLVYAVEKGEDGKTVDHLGRIQGEDEDDNDWAESF